MRVPVDWMQSARFPHINRTSFLDLFSLCVFPAEPSLVWVRPKINLTEVEGGTILIQLSCSLRVILRTFLKSFTLEEATEDKVTFPLMNFPLHNMVFVFKAKDYKRTSFLENK